LSPFLFPAQSGAGGKIISQATRTAAICLKYLALLKKSAAITALPLSPGAIIVIERSRRRGGLEFLADWSWFAVIRKV
jgi:hypothetical protein